MSEGEKSGAGAPRSQCKQVSALMNFNKKIVIAGGSGFLGAAISKKLIAHNYDVVILTRSNHDSSVPGSKLRYVYWNATSLGDWTSELEGAGALINLTGRSINCIHTDKNKREIIESRVNSVRVLAEALSRCKVPPPLWIQASALGIYGDVGERICDEGSPAGTGFLAETCTLWEEAFEKVPASIRKVTLRIGFVLGREGGGLPPLIAITKAFLGGTVGSGRQYISWIHIADICELVHFAIEGQHVHGTLNATAPAAVPNREFMKTLRSALSRPWCPPAPEWAVRIGARYILRTDPVLALTGQRAVPKRATEYGFTFRFTELRAALKDLLNTKC